MIKGARPKKAVEAYLIGRCAWERMLPSHREGKRCLEPPTHKGERKFLGDLGQALGDGC